MNAATSRFVGREAELGAAVAFVDGLGRRGRGGLLAVAGEAGVGKSRFVEELVRNTSGRHVLRARCVANASAPLRLVSELATMAVAARPSYDDDPVLATFWPILAHVAPVADVAPSPTLAVPLLAAGVLELLRRAGPTTAVLEDLHWADPASLECLELWADHAPSGGVVLIVTVRDDERSPALPTLRRLAARDAACLITLGRLSPEDSHALAAACLAVESRDSEQARRLAEIAAGLPLLIEGLAAGPGVADRRVPPVFADVVGARLDTIPVESRAMLQLAAAIGDDVAFEVLGPAVGPAVRDAEASGLLVREGGRTAFRHALVADAVLDQLAPAELAALRRRAADLVAETGVASEALEARRAELLAGAGDGEAAARLLESLGSAALAGGRLPAAAELLARSAALARRAGLSALVVSAERTWLKALVASGSAEEAAEVGASLLSRMTDPRVPGEAPSDVAAVHLLVAEALTGVRNDEAARHLREARALGDGPTLSRADIVDARLSLASSSPDRPVVAEALARRALDGAERHGLPLVAAEACEIVGQCVRLRDLEAAEGAFERQLELARRAEDPLLALRALNELGTIDLLRTLDPRRVIAARAAAVDAGAVALAAHYDINIAGAQLFTGRHAAASRTAAQCEDLARRLGLGDLAATARVWRATAAAYRGEAEVMEELLAGVAQPRGLDVDVAEWALCRAMLALVREDRAGARAALANADRLARARAPLLGNVTGGPGLLLQLVDGEVDPSLELPAPDTFAVRWDRMHQGFCRAVLDGYRGRAEAAEAAFSVAREAALVYALHGPLYLRLVAEAALRDGWGDAVSWLMEAEAAFVAQGLGAPTSACRGLLRAAGVRIGRRDATQEASVPAPLRRAGVTAREVEVLRLVADRLSNREIAARLYLSVRTVEKHVASLMTKLGVESRAQLRGRAAADGW